MLGRKIMKMAGLSPVRGDAFLKMENPSQGQYKLHKNMSYPASLTSEDQASSKIPFPFHDTQIIIIHKTASSIPDSDLIMVVEGVPL
jgi:hypothetical protein